MHPPTDGYPTVHSGGAKNSWFKQIRCAYSLFWVTLLQLWKNNEHCDMNEGALESGGVVSFCVSALKLVTCPGCTHLWLGGSWDRLQSPGGSWTDHISGRTCSTGYTEWQSGGWASVDNRRFSKNQANVRRFSFSSWGCCSRSTWVQMYVLQAIQLFNT